MNFGLWSGFFDLPWWGYVLTALALTHITIAGVTIFLHRHQAHRALDLHPLPSHFFRLWLWLTTGMLTKEWAAIHRKHHAKCETVDDPHSPQVLGLSKVLWTGVFLYVKESHNAETLQRYGQGTPNDWLERNIYTPGQKIGILVTLGIDLLLFGAVPGVLIWATQMLWIPFWAAGVINGVGHFWGYRNFKCEDASTNIFPWGILIGGEELHNNHHSFAASAKLSNKWYEFDIGWLYIRILETLGLAHVKKVAPVARLGETRAEVDFATLQAVITHRYDLLANYLRKMQQVAREELDRKQAAFNGNVQELKALRASFLADASELSADMKARLESLLQGNERLAQLYRMRQELEGIWARSNASREQVLKQLQDWVARAEASGIAALEETAMRLRRYRVA